MKFLFFILMGVSVVHASPVDISRCYSLKDNDLRQQCLAQARDSINPCYNVKDRNAQYNCKANITGNINYCYSINDPQLKNACKAGMSVYVR